MPIISIPKPLREKLGEEGTDALVQVLNENEKETRSSVVDFAEQRFERHLTEEIAGVRVDLADAEKRFEKHLTEEIAGVRLDLAEAKKRFEKHLTEEIADLRGSLQKTRSDTIKWMFLFWIGQIGAVLGIILAVFK
jgi:bifunctional DNA-binding transcriptional regulator/antitoxin component of YhaV-PrlF toxin-antitoxin module